MKVIYKKTIVDKLIELRREQDTIPTRPRVDHVELTSEEIRELSRHFGMFFHTHQANTVLGFNIKEVT